MNDVFFLARSIESCWQGIYISSFLIFSFSLRVCGCREVFFVHLSIFLWFAYTGLSVWLSDQERFGKMTSVIQYDYGAWWK